jgi:hypothetical protein
MKRAVLGFFLGINIGACGEDGGTGDDGGTSEDSGTGDDGDTTGDHGGTTGDDGGTTGDDSGTPTGPTVTVRPTEIDDILYNPGMGFADFHGNAPPLDEHPTPTVAYYRWTWAELEPVEGQFEFDLVDGVIDDAKAKGETLAFRIMTVWQDSSPQWLLDMGVDSVEATDGVFPDHNDPIFLEYHERLVRAFGERYAGSPDIDHVDIGSVGCWGEWNTACCEATQPTCDQYFPTEANQEAIVDWYFDAFPATPLVMLIGGNVEYAVSRGSGWRGDCFGDYGVFGPDWNHMDDSYGPAAADPIIGEAWKTAPVQFEVCGVMQDWHDSGFDIDLILEKGLDWHMSVLNAKSSPVPPDWRSRIDEFHKRMGYRMVLREMTHTSEAAPGDSLLLRSDWENLGVAPVYHPWPLAYRLRSDADEVVAEWTSSADLVTWLPGPHQVDDVVQVPGDVAAGTYSLEVAILTEDESRAHVLLAIEGARADRWYALSEVQVGG